MKSTPYVLYALLCFSELAVADGSTLAFTQSADRSVLAVYDSGSCPVGPNPNQTIAPVVSIDASQVNISSYGGIAGPYGTCNPRLVPGFMLPASLGKLADGHYTVTWTYSPGQITGAFDVVQGSLVTSNGATFPHPSAISGLWYDPAYTGSGFNFQLSYQGLLVTYYGWDAAGNRLWLTSDIGPSSLAVDGPVVLNMTYTTGGVFGNPQHNLAQWGQLIVKFSSCQAARITLSGKDGMLNSSPVLLAGIVGLPGC